MELSFDLYLEGLRFFANPLMFAYSLFGVFVGIVFGALPGLTATMTIAVFIFNAPIDPGFIDPYIDYIYEAEVAYQSLFNLAYTHETTGQAEVEEDQWGIWEFKFKPDELQELNLAVGSRREGLTCSGGVCRLEPAFDGVRVDYLRRF